MKYRQGEMHNRAKIPQKLTTTVYFIENESSCCRQISKTCELLLFSRKKLGCVGVSVACTPFFV